ncbi:MAG: hypothetical protein ABEK16_04985, partial [Candidatus Nanohalobium sp.]
DEFEGEMDVAILGNTARLSSTDPSYAVKIWDNARPETFETVEITTSITNSEGTIVYENVQNVSVGDVIIRDFRPGDLQPGTYTIKAEVRIDGKKFTGVKTVEIVEEDESITGDFTQGNFLMDFLTGLWKGITSIF